MSTFTQISRPLHGLFIFTPHNFTMRCDLHVHTIASGMFTAPVLNRICRESYTEPADVYARLKRRGMCMVTVTDHDSIEGAEALPRPACRIPVVAFDGLNLPYPSGTFGACLLIDVLHHADRPAALLAEAARVGSGRVILKDHLREGFAAAPCLRFMDEVGNRRHGVPLPRGACVSQFGVLWRADSPCNSHWLACACCWVTPACRAFALAAWVALVTKACWSRSSRVIVNEASIGFGA